MANNMNNDPGRKAGHMGPGANQQDQVPPPKGASLGHRVTTADLDEDGHPRPPRDTLREEQARGIHTDD